nr:hypothetical protein [Hymenobacter sp. BRD67]
MRSLLLRRLRLLPALVLALLALAAGPVQATHLLGGEMTYRYLDNNGPATAPVRYEITVTIYNNCGTTANGQTPAAPNAFANVGIYDQATGTRVVLTALNSAFAATNSSPTDAGQTGMLKIPSTSLSGCLAPHTPSGCQITGVSQPFKLQKFIAVVSLPASIKGYYAVFTRSARNDDVTNLTNPGSQALTLYATLSPPLLPNRSPVFSDTAVAIICANDTTMLLNNAVDADGDRLVYSFGQPYGNVAAVNGELPTTSFTPPPPPVPYKAGYTAGTPFGTGTGNFATLNASTGIAKYGSTNVGGKYVVAVDVNEYRTINGREVLVGTTRRDLQLVVANCPPTVAPLLPSLASTPRSYSIEEGQVLSIPLTVTQANNHPLVLTLNSVLLDGAGASIPRLTAARAAWRRVPPRARPRLRARALPQALSCITRPVARPALRPTILP